MQAFWEVWSALAEQQQAAMVGAMVAIIVQLLKWLFPSLAQVEDRWRKVLTIGLVVGFALIGATVTGNWQDFWMAVFAAIAIYELAKFGGRAVGVTE